MRLPAFFLLALALAASSLAPQEPGGEPSFAGNWTGSGKFTTAAPSAPCQYAGAETPPAVVVDLAEKDAVWSGQVALDLEGTATPPCAPIKARYKILETRVEGNSLAFTDAAGNEWSLTLREGRLQGMVTSPHLGGEVSLAREGEPPAPTAAASGQPAAGPPAPSPPTSGRGPSGSGSPGPGTARKPAAPHGSAWGGIATVTAVTAVGAAGFLGVNKLLQDKGTGQTGAQTCSPRACILSAPCENVTPGSCSNNVTTGADCGTTTSGVPVNQKCSPPTLPCQSDLFCLCSDPACSNGTCQPTDVCPFLSGGTTRR